MCQYANSPLTVGIPLLLKTLWLIIIRALPIVVITRDREKQTNYDSADFNVTQYCSVESICIGVSLLRDK